MNNMPPSYIPPGPPARRGPSCWLVGGLTCLGIVVLVIIAIIVGITSFTHSATGKKFASSMGSVFRGASMLPECKENMLTIRGAIMRYHDHTGHYPDNLRQLVPTYITDSSILHCPLDSVSDPSHVTYIYTKPSGSTPASAPLLTLHWLFTMNMGPQSQTTDTELIVTVGGQVSQQQTQTRSTNASASIEDGHASFSPGDTTTSTSNTTTGGSTTVSQTTYSSKKTTE